MNPFSCTKGSAAEHCEGDVDGFLRVTYEPLDAGGIFETVENELELLALLVEHQAVDFVADTEVSVPQCFIFCFKTLQYPVTCLTLSDQGHNFVLLCWWIILWMVLSFPM